jgi:hypothetical protein
MTRSNLIPRWKLRFLGKKPKKSLRRLRKMFEEIASDAVKMLMFLFFVTLAFIMLSGALWLRASKHNA